MSRLFGTDGVRGRANAELTPELALQIGQAAARVIVGAQRGTAVVGRDPRVSGDMLEAALAAGLMSAGVDVLRAGVIPTPGLAFLTAQAGADLGVMLTASHNPMPDNGIKILARGGLKLPDAAEDQIADTIGQAWERPQAERIGRAYEYSEGQALYLRHLLAATPGRLDGLHIVVDAAHGAASPIAGEAYAQAGARVTLLNAAPDGLNINDNCGSTHLPALASQVLAHGADLGLAHDGDADRCLAIDAAGQVVDGDQIMAILALAMRERAELPDATVVVTVMSNLGFHHAMHEAGIRVIETPVGDRHVLEAMRTGGHRLGGEQSGHVILSAHATTGDGLLTGLTLAARVAATGRPLAELAGVVRRLPQVLLNVAEVDASRVGIDAGVLAAVEQARAELAGSGRVLLRASGTEPLVRIMVEAGTVERAQQLAEDLADVVRTRLGRAATLPGAGLPRQ